MTKTTIVTGGGRGIGAATARLAAKRGHAICVNYVDKHDIAQSVVDSILADGGRAVAIQGDVASESDIRRLFDETERVLGTVHCLINNAGITGLIKPFIETESDTMRRVFDVNVIGSMLCAREFARRLVTRNEKGQIVNLSSVAATLGAAGEYIHYAASKAAIDAFTIGLAKELAPYGIRVNAVAPGSTYTDIHATAGEPTRPERVKSRIPMGRLGKPEEIAEAIVWLLSDASSYATGAILRVGGGF
jgi:NAD(P)-dependent dehydrogenase (short-subunit alcohol dehydrogenase family)